MAKEEFIEADEKAERKRLAEEKKKLKEEKKAQRKEAKARAKDIIKRERNLEEEGETGNGSVFLVTLIIVVVWVAILCLLIKLDVGGFGSGVLAPVLKNVPVLNQILPSGSELVVDESGQEAYGGYRNLREAVDYIKELELELERSQTVQSGSTEEVENLRAEVERLKEFEDRQVEFQRIKTEFAEEVIYAENGPGAEEYRKYYEEMDPSTAEFLYKQVVQQGEEAKLVTDYAKAYSEMKPKAAALIFEAMTDQLELAARILKIMDSKSRGSILGVMDPAVAAQLTKIMNPEY